MSKYIAVIHASETILNYEVFEDKRSAEIYMQGAEEMENFVYHSNYTFCPHYVHIGIFVYPLECPEELRSKLAEIVCSLDSESPEL